MTKKTGSSTPQEYAKHLRPYGKKEFWKRERRDCGLAPCLRTLNRRTKGNRKKDWRLEYTVPSLWYKIGSLHWKHYSSRAAAENAAKAINKQSDYKVKVKE